MKIHQIEKHPTGLNRISINIELVPETAQERDAIMKTSKGTATNEQKSMLENQIEKYCKSLSDHFVLISAKVSINGMTELVLEQTGNITV